MREEGYVEDDGSSRLDNLEELCEAAKVFPPPAIKEANPAESGATVAPGRADSADQEPAPVRLGMAGGPLIVAMVLARVGKIIPTTNLILAGVAFSSFATSLTSFLMLRSTNEIRRALGWLLGGASQSGWTANKASEIACIASPLFCGVIADITPVSRRRLSPLMPSSRVRRANCAAMC